MKIESPLLLGAVDLTEVIDTDIALGNSPRADEVGNRNGGQQADRGDHNHEFNQREGQGGRETLPPERANTRALLNDPEAETEEPVATSGDTRTCFPHNSRVHHYYQF